VTETQPRPFDERAALEELERLADRIQSTRRQRERAVAEFNAFVKNFKDEDHSARWKAVHALARPAAVATVPEPAPMPPPAPAQPLPPPFPPRPDSIPPTAPAAFEPIAQGAFENDAESMSWSAPRGGIDVAALLATPRGRIALAAVALLTLVLLVAWLGRGSRGESISTPRENAPAAAQAAPAPATQTPSSTTPAAPSQPGPTPVASTGAPRAVNVVLMTSRPVWTRVTVDDRKVIERELPGGQTIPLGADRTILIRAGDAGAIRVIVDGKDAGVLGRDGQIASRTFSAPSAAR
jgi:hypothetical protein